MCSIVHKTQHNKLLGGAIQIEMIELRET